MNHTAPQATPLDWLEAIDDSDAQLAAGQAVPLSLVLAELKGTIAHIEAKLAQDQAAPRASSTPPKS